MEHLSKHYVSYKDFKQVLDTEMTRVAVGFVRIGFLLNYAEETNIIAEGGYETVADFVKAEYDIDETQISRFTRIYQRFGVPGEPRLQDQYMDHGVAKLGIMLTLPDFINEEISSDYSKGEINAIKKEIEAEKKISDIEVMCEEKSTLQQLLPEGLKQVVLQFVKDYPQEYVKIYDAITLDDLKEIMAPNELGTYKIRIPGVGLNLMFVKVNENIVVTNTRNGEKNTYEWEDFFEAVKDYFVLGNDAKESWSNIFQEPFPEEEEPAKPENDNVQQAKQTTRKESKVKTPAPKPKKEPKAESKAVEPVKEVEEQISGQDSILNHPEYLPENMQTEVLTGEIEDVPEPSNPDNDNVQQSSDDFKVQEFAPVQEDKKNTIRGLKAGIKAALTIALDKCEQDDWITVYGKATDIVWRTKKIMELEEKK